jgi:hypothetical protein
MKVTNELAYCIGQLIKGITGFLSQANSVFLSGAMLLTLGSGKIGRNRRPRMTLSRLGTASRLPKLTKSFFIVTYKWAK